MAGRSCRSTSPASPSVNSASGSRVTVDDSWECMTRTDLSHAVRNQSEVTVSPTTARMIALPPGTSNPIASVIAYATGPILGYFIPVTHPFSRRMFVTSIRPAIASLAMGLVVYPMKNHIISSLIVGSATYFLILWLVRGIHAQDRELLRSLRFTDRFGI